MLAELARIRRDGHAMDEGEQEIGVRCVAVPVHGALGTLGHLRSRARHRG